MADRRLAGLANHRGRPTNHSLLAGSSKGKRKEMGGGRTRTPPSRTREPFHHKHSSIIIGIAIT